MHHGYTVTPSSALHNHHTASGTAFRKGVGSWGWHQERRACTDAAIERMQEQRQLPVARQRMARGGNREHAEGTESTRGTALRVEPHALASRHIHPHSQECFDGA